MKNEDKKGYKSVTWRRNTAYISPLAASGGRQCGWTTINEIES